jgi:hypothetical protein
MTHSSCQLHVVVRRQRDTLDADLHLLRCKLEATRYRADLNVLMIDQLSDSAGLPNEYPSHLFWAAPVFFLGTSACGNCGRLK